MKIQISGSRLLRAIFSVFLFAVTLPCAIPVYADSTYQIAGTLSIPANSSYPGVNETINFKFQIDYVTGNSDIPFEAQLVPGSATVISSGPIGNYSVSATGPGDQFGYVPFFGPVGYNSTADEIDLYINGLAQFSGPSAPSVSNYGPVLYDCSTISVCTQFVPDNEGGAAAAAKWLGQAGPLGKGTANYTVAAVPEASSLFLLTAAFALILLITAARGSVRKQRLRQSEGQFSE